MFFTFFWLVVMFSMMKQNKSLLLVIFMEVLTVLVMVSLILIGDSLPFSMIVVFSFFVSESLIVLSVLYSTMRLIGGVFGCLSFY